jgi:YbbR domain-containing protein
MLKFVRKFFTENIGLKLLSLALALIAWFYIVQALNEGSQEEMQFLRKILPSEGMVAKKLTIKPIFIGKPKGGYVMLPDKVVVTPSFCIVVGTKDVLENVRFAYTMALDISGLNKTVTRSVPLSPIAPGVYMEETLVEVTVPVEKVAQ